jgi:hypothetical protein
MEGELMGEERTNPDGQQVSGPSGTEETLDEHTKSGDDMRETRERWGEHAPGGSTKATGPGTGSEGTPAGTEGAKSFPHRESGNA